MSTQTIGEYFRQFRKDRGLSLTQAVATADCSAAALSRFERDQSDLSLAAIEQIMQNLRLTTSDFYTLLTQQPAALGEPAYVAYIRQDQAALAALATGFWQTFPHDTQRLPLVYADVLLKTSQMPHTAHYHLLPNQEKALAHFLKPSPLWNITQTLTIAAALRFASHELLALITDRFIQNVQAIDETTVNESILREADLALLLFHLLCRREAALSQPLLEAMQTYHTLRRQHLQPGTSRDVHSINSAPYVHFGQAMADWLAKPSVQAEERVRAESAKLRTLGAVALADYFDRVWPQVKQGRQSWHNPALTAALNRDPLALPDRPMFSGPVVKQIRQFYGLTLADLSVNWRPATQSRFEAGQTQLGFRDALNLVHLLMLNDNIFYPGLFSYPLAAFDHQVAAHATLPRQEAIKAALIEARATAAHQSLVYDRFAIVNVEVHAIQMTLDLVGDDDATLAFLDLSYEQMATETLAGLRATKHVQNSDLVVLERAIQVLPPAAKEEAWHLAFTSSRLPVNDSLHLTNMYSNLIFSLTLDGDFPRMKRLAPALPALQNDDTSLVGIFPLATTQYLIELFSSPATATSTWQRIHRDTRWIREYVQPKAGATVWMGNQYDILEVEVQEAFDQWQAAQE